MIKLSIELSVESPLIVTSRDSGVLYRDIDWDSFDKRGTKLISKNPEMITQLYPMYHNGRDYYIPATTIKGNIMKLVSNKSIAQNLFVKDCLVSKEHVEIRQLGKIILVKKVERELEEYQEKTDEKRGEESQLKQISAENAFFPMVAHEMIFDSEKVIKLTIDVECRDIKTVQIVSEALKKNQDIDVKFEKNKLQEIIKQAEEQEEGYCEKVNEVLLVVNQLVEKVEKSKNSNGNICFLGGYRGFYRAFIESEHSAIYYVEEENNYYPIGLCTLKIREETEYV